MNETDTMNRLPLGQLPCTCSFDGWSQMLNHHCPIHGPAVHQDQKAANRAILLLLEAILNELRKS